MVTKSEALEIWNMASEEDRKQILNPASENQFAKLPVQVFKLKINPSFSNPAKTVIANLVRRWLK
ncbi:MAG: hypothetical protein V3U54_13510 [Thermodesulfobacteriota bacterium]